MTLKLWIDDERTPPDETWAWAKSSRVAINLLNYASYYGGRMDEIAFDHDLGGTDDTRVVMDWIIEHNYWPNRISIHSGNPVGHRALYRSALVHAPETTELVAKFK